MRSFADLLQQPYYYRPSAFVIHPRLAAELASVVCRSQQPIYKYDALMREAPREYGCGRRETGENVGFGVSFTNPAEAMAKSIFEAWERKFSKVYSQDELTRAAYRELALRAVDPHTFSLISDWEYQQSPLNYVRYTPDLQLSWKECYRVADGKLEPVLIPATLVYSRFSWKNPGERFAANLSPGLACHATFREAFVNGLCELLERDAFMLTWLRRKCPPRICPESVEWEDADAAYRQLIRLGFAVHFLDLTTNIGIPVVMTVIEHSRLPWSGALVLGLGCALDPREALRKSLLEALIMLANHVSIDWQQSQLVVKPRPLPYGLNPTDYYRHVRFLLDSPDNVPIQQIANLDRRDAARNLLFLIDHLNNLGYATYFVDLTPPGYEDCRICLTRALIAGLQPMLYEPDCWRLNAHRLFGKEPPAYEQLNLLPHPFMLLE